MLQPAGKAWKSLKTWQPAEKTTFRFHIIYALADGLLQGTFALNEFVFLKQLGASSWQLSILFQLAVFVLPFSIFLTEWLSRVKRKKQVVIFIAIITRLPLLLCFLFPQAIFSLVNKEQFITVFLAIFLLYHFANPVILPIINVITKANYSTARFARLFSLAMAATQVVWLLATLSFGQLLDFDGSSYRYVYPILGILGFVSLFLLTKIPFENEPVEEKSTFSFKKTFTKAVEILKTNRAFFDFQLGMMVYGMGFLMTLAVITLFLSRHLNLSYSEIALYKTIPIIISVAVFPFYGSRIGKKDPRLLAVQSCFFLFMFFVCLMAMQFWPNQFLVSNYRIMPMLWIAFIFHGFFTGSMGLVWGIGSSYFSPAGQTARYHSIHLSLTGLRGLIAPFIGIWLFEWLSYTGAFSVAALTELAAMYILYRSAKKRSLNV